jgi:Glutamine amidotransferase class-I
VEIVEAPDHPWFLGCQFHPEFKSKPLEPHPLFAAFIGAALQHKKERSKPASAGVNATASHDGQHAPAIENPRTPVLRAAPHATA